MLKKDYPNCIETATTRFDKGEIKTCPRGYCTAKAKYQVYPSAYANGYASSVCQGDNPDIDGITKPNQKYMERIGKLKSGEIKQKTNMGRWFRENWVDVCKPKINNEYQPCGRSKAKLQQKNYPYCRPEIRIDDNTPVTVGEIIDGYGKNQLKTLCQQKRSHKQGVSGTPFYLRTDKTKRLRDDNLDIDRLILAIQSKTYSNGGFNLPEFRNQIVMWMNHNLTTNQINKLANKLGLKTSKTDFLKDFKISIINDDRKSLIDLCKSLGITKNNLSVSSRNASSNNASNHNASSNNASNHNASSRKSSSNEASSRKSSSNEASSRKSSSNEASSRKSDRSTTSSNNTSPNMKLINQYHPIKKCITNNLYKPRKSVKGKKKIEIDVLDKDNQEKTVYFGHNDYQDYTRHQDKTRMKNYCKRSGGIRCNKLDNGICDQTSPNFWSRQMLWNCDNNKKEICKSISDKTCREKLKC